MRSQRWRFVHDGVEYLPYGRRVDVANYLAWLLELEVSFVLARIEPVELVPSRPGVAKARLNTLAAPVRASRKAGVA